MRARDAAQGEGTFADAADGLGELPGASLIRRQSTARSLAADAMWRELRKASELQKEMELATVDPAEWRRRAAHKMCRELTYAMAGRAIWIVEHREWVLTRMQAIRRQAFARRAFVADIAAPLPPGDAWWAPAACIPRTCASTDGSARSGGLVRARSRGAERRRRAASAVTAQGRAPGLVGGTSCRGVAWPRIFDASPRKRTASAASAAVRSDREVSDAASKEHASIPAHRGVAAALLATFAQRGGARCPAGAMDSARLGSRRRRGAPPPVEIHRACARSVAAGRSPPRGAGCTLLRVAAGA